MGELNEPGTFPSVKFPAVRMLKASEIRSLSAGEVEREVAVLRRHIIEMNLMAPSRLKARQQNQKDDTDTSLKKKYSKQIARLLTVRREMELDEWVSKRESRAMHRATKGKFLGIPV